MLSDEIFEIPISNLKYKSSVKYKKSKSPAIEMIAGLNFNIQMIYLSKKGRVKCRASTDFYCNLLKFNISEIA